MSVFITDFEYLSIIFHGENLKTLLDLAQCFVQVPVGKISFDAAKLEENIKALYQQLVKIRPSTVKGSYVLNVTISSTMGPGIKVSFDSLDN